MRTSADLKEIQAHWCHFMLQPSANLWFKAQIRITADCDQLWG
jgi:hypothetical protein